MLAELTIRNYALIDTLSVSFEQGLNIITGETGAGKSIIVGAISFLLGAKADIGIIRAGCEEVSVSAVVQLQSKSPELRAWLAIRDIVMEDGEIVVRRTLKKNGRGAIFIQNVPVPRSDLAECMAFLFDIHGQHDHESLLRPASHRKYLDQFAGLEAEVSAFNKLFCELSGKRKLLENSAISQKEREERQEILAFAIDEIDKAALKNGESRELETESARLASFEKLSRHIENACEAFCGSQTAALSLTRKAQSALSAAAALDSGLSALDSRLSELYYEAEDVAAELKDYRGSLSFDPERLEYVEERLALINKLKKKYAKPAAAPTSVRTAAAWTPAPTAQAGGNEDGLFTGPEESILSYKADAEAELDALSRTEENREHIKSEIAALEKTIFEAANNLSGKRAAAGKRLSARISAIFGHLGMSGAEFTISLEQKGRRASAEAENVQGSYIIGPYGADNVEFLFTPIKGEGARELARIASGGELSRVMLAIKTALITQDGAGNAVSTAGEFIGFGGGTDCRSSSDAGGGHSTAAGVHAENSAAEDSAETLIFDEIDTGIGGEVATAVGAYLAGIGTVKQIFCVTHLAVIAAKARHHLKVEKQLANGRTITSLRPLANSERREEIARMLSGNSSGAALAHAEELLQGNNV